MDQQAQALCDRAADSAALDARPSRRRSRRCNGRCHERTNRSVNLMKRCLILVDRFRSSRGGRALGVDDGVVVGGDLLTRMLGRLALQIPQLVHGATLHRRTRPGQLDRPPQTRVAVDNAEHRRLQPARHEVIEEAPSTPRATRSRTSPARGVACSRRPASPPRPAPARSPPCHRCAPAARRASR